MRELKRLVPRGASLAVALLLVGGILVAPGPAEASCWKCFYRFIRGSEFFPDRYFEYCAPQDGPGAWNCYMYGEDCIEYGACEDYVWV